MIGALLPYRAALWLASPLLAGYTLWRGMRDGGALYCKQRLGMQVPAIERPLWVHCASVGEVSAVLPLLKAIRDRHRNLPLLVTTNTQTSREVLLKQMAGQVTHAYLPVDLYPGVARFVRHVRPRCAVITETELWPNLYQQCESRGVPVILINARLSKRTLNAPFPVRGAYRHVLGQVRAVLAKSQEDADRFSRMGAPPERIETLGNLKFARHTISAVPAPADLVRRPYLLAASTHNDEELRITQIWRRLPRTDQVLVIAPRHPERRAQILRALRPLGMATAVRSRGDPITPGTRIYLADTLGELNALMSHAMLVFMGGSLAPSGGHNILEPARLGKAILVGPHMDNFTDETRSLLAAEAMMMVRDDHELTLALERLLADEELRATLGRTAAEFMAKQADVAQAYLQRLETLIGLSAEPGHA